MAEYVSSRKNVNVRKLVINNFRNIGITYDKKEQPSHLILNRGLNKEDLGDLVFLVGPNNSGKSNVLAALGAFGKNKFEEHDSPDFMYSNQNPVLSMIVQNDNAISSLKIDGTKNNKNVPFGEIEVLEQEINELNESLEKLRIQKLDITEEMDILNSELTKNKDKYPTEAERETIKDIIQKGSIRANTKHDLEAYLSKFTKTYGSASIPSSFTVVEKRILELTEQEPILNKYKEFEVSLDSINFSLADIKEKIEEKRKLLSKTSVKLADSGKTQKPSVEKTGAVTQHDLEYGYLLSPRIVVYTQKPIKQNDLNCKPNNPTDFIRNIFKIMGRQPDTLDNVYQKYAGKNQKGYLNIFTEELNKDLPDKITKLFNDMYFCDEGEEYIFEFDLESEKVHVSLYRGTVPLDLDKQSAGFKWFFDFFFNFAYKEDLKPGDIIIMDEPATNIHVSGQVELRKFLKELAKKNGLTFVISTHSPFLIDCNWLDELRLMQRDERGHVKIEDKFDVVSGNADKLDPVLNSLTVGRHVMTGAQKVIFTEGITDYNYLTAFKLLFSEKKPEYNSLVFLPVGGITNDENLVTQLCKIDTNPILLVDGDRAGSTVKKKAENTKLNVISLNELNPSHKVIESLFSPEDAIKYNVKNKEWNESSLFKKKIFENEISEETKNNFEEVLKCLLNA
jgi:Predicted ATPase